MCYGRKVDGITWGSDRFGFWIFCFQEVYGLLLIFRLYLKVKRFFLVEKNWVFILFLLCAKHIDA